MSDAEKCSSIAKFERDPNSEHGGTICDYPHDLNATMRAARRLPDEAALVVESGSRGGEAWIDDHFRGEGEHIANRDAARAAFEALAAYLTKERP